MGHRADKGPCLPSPPQPAAHRCSWPICSERHKERQAAGGPALAYGSGAWVLTDTTLLAPRPQESLLSPAIYTDLSTSGNEASLRFSSTVLTPRQVPGWLGDGCLGPHHQRKYENAPPTHRSGSAPPCPGTAPLREEGALVCRAHLSELDSRTRPAAQKGAKHTQVPREPVVRRVTACGIRANPCTGAWLIPTLPLTEVCPW